MALTLKINSGKTVIVDFGADWCAPCKAISPVYHTFSEDEAYKDLEFYEIDVDKQRDISYVVAPRTVR